MLWPWGREWTFGCGVGIGIGLLLVACADTAQPDSDDCLAVGALLLVIGSAATSRTSHGDCAAQSVEFWQVDGSGFRAIS